MILKSTFFRVLILALSLGSSALLWAQKEPIRHLYAYNDTNDKSLVKAKTDLFLLNVLASERFTMTTNSSGEDHLDVNLIAPYEKGEISTRVRYDFLASGYVVSLSNTQIHGKDKAVVLINDPNNELHQKLLEQFEKLFFSTYEKELKKS